MDRALPATSAASPVATPRRTWTVPTLRELPKLAQLTLASAIGGGGGTGGGGSTVFGLLLAIGLLAGCVADPTLAPSGESHPLPQTISCRATVATGAIECGGPQLDAPTPEILGGQGRLVALRSSNVAYDGSAIFQADVSIQNLAAQTLGGDAQGIDVFFVSAPTVTGGTGTVTVNNPTGNGTFTHSGQDYFHYSDSIPTLVTSSALTWKWNVPATVSTFSFNVELSAGFTDPGGVLLWSEVPQFASDSFVDIAVNSSTDAMAVGVQGRVYRKTGSTWAPQSNSAGQPFVAIEAIGNGQYLGATMFDVYLFDGKVWKFLDTPGFQILSLGGTAADRIIVGGFEHIAWLGSGGWHSAGITGRTYQWVAAIGGDQAIALATSSGQVRINLNSAAINSTSDGFDHTAFYAGLGGDFGFGAEVGGVPPAYIRDDASSFLYGPASDTIIDAIDFGATASERWAVARSNTSGGSVLMHLNSGVWSTVASLPGPVVRMTQDSAGGLYLVFADGIRRWNGSALVDELVGPQTTYPTAIGGGAGYAFVGMNDGEIRRYDGASWTTTGNPGGFLRVASMAAFSATSAAVLDTAGQYSLWNGSAWSFVSTYAGARAIWGVDATHMVMLAWSTAAGGLSTVRHGDPFGTFTFNVNPGGLNTPLNAVWGGSDTDFWVAGNGGVVLYYDGSTYTAHAPGTALDLRAITGTSNTDLWVAGSSGYIAHWDGGSWTQCTIGGSTITTLFSPRPGVVYVGTGATTDTLTAISCGARAIRIPGAYEPVTGLSGSSAEALWAIVATRVYWGHR